MKLTLLTTTLLAGLTIAAPAAELDKRQQSAKCLACQTTALTCVTTALGGGFTLAGLTALATCQADLQKCQTKKVCRHLQLRLAPPCAGSTNADLTSVHIKHYCEDGMEDLVLGACCGCLAGNAGNLGQHVHEIANGGCCRSLRLDLDLRALGARSTHDLMREILRTHVATQRTDDFAKTKSSDRILQVGPFRAQVLQSHVFVESSSCS